MSDEFKIGRHIYNNTLFGDRCKFSTLTDLNEFFAPVPEDVQKLWMLDMSEEGYETRYEKAVIVSEQLGVSKALYVCCEIFDTQNSYKISRKISFDDDKLIFVHEAALQQKGCSGANFSHQIMSKTQKFLSEYDKTRRINYITENSEVYVQAHSNPKGEVPTFGGYVWANQGFDFASKQELTAIRESFKIFLSTYQVELEEKDLKKFTKPCHFAAFGCGITAQDNNGNNVHLGKAFMLRQKWFGKWTTANPKAEEKRYAQAYNTPGILSTSRRSHAVEALGKNYRMLLNKYYSRYAHQKNNQQHKNILKELLGKKISELIFSHRD